LRSQVGIYVVALLVEARLHELGLEVDLRRVQRTKSQELGFGSDVDEHCELKEGPGVAEGHWLDFEPVCRHQFGLHVVLEAE